LAHAVVVVLTIFYFCGGAYMQKLEKRIGSTLVDILFDILGGFLYAVGYYTFAKMGDFTPGGVSGVALIFNYLYSVPVGIFTLIFNIPLVILSYKVVGKKFLFKTAKTLIFCTIFLDVIAPMTPLYTGSRITASLFSGVCLGASMALFYMRGSSSGGMDFLIMTVKVKKPYFSFGFVTIVTDFIVIAAGGLIYKDIDSVLYGLISAFTCSIVMDKILYGMGAGKLIIIITVRSKELTDMIGSMTDRGSTIIKAIGSYTGDDRDVVLCACSKNQTYAVTDLAHKADPHAFIMITETSEVFGEGFIEGKRNMSSN
jgi:uncharacterized membrane-anchored protein YitT (DUF2179 family)